MVGYAIGRVGCQLSGDGDYGHARGTDHGRWPIRTAPCRPTTPVHPTPVYETLVLWVLRRASCSGGSATGFRPGILFATYLIVAGFERFMVEFVRRNGDAALGLTQAQLLASQ